MDTRDERMTKLQDYINRRPHLLESPQGAKILSLAKEFLRNQEGERKMKHRKRDTASGVSSINSNIARAMRGRIPKVPANRAPQVTVAQPIIIPPPTNTPPKNCRLRLINCRSH